MYCEPETVFQALVNVACVVVLVGVAFWCGQKSNGDDAKEEGKA